MHPDPQQDPRYDDPGRIIHLGEVRRRRRSAGVLPDRHYLAGMLTAAVLGWLSWITVVLTVPPSKLLTYLAFFVPLWLALSATGSALAHMMESRALGMADFRHSVRRGALFGVVVVANLVLLAAHRWSLPALAVLCGAALFVDVVRSLKPD